MLLEIEDDGAGFDVFRTANRSHGQGLRNMQERARALQGELEIDSEEGRGTRILISVPLPIRALVSADD
ncbi:MAG: ATP-binding protein, partial [Caldilineaceae bacterium]